MTHTFNCTSCGAPLEYTDGMEHAIRCQFCGNSVPVPEEFWREAEMKQTTKKWGKYLLIFLVVTVGIPTCLGLVGSLLGIGGSLIGIIVGFLAQVFGR
ncbi:MAG: hypothetical protein HY781_09920 [Chloroflexi bacterium]|nr:hypothetical protein [Chloroflexota bacterium]